MKTDNFIRKKKKMRRRKRNVCVKILKLGYGSAATTYGLMKKCSGADCYNVLSWSCSFSMSSPSASKLVIKSKVVGTPL